MRNRKASTDVLRTPSREGALLAITLLLIALIVRVIYTPNKYLLNVYYISHDVLMSQEWTRSVWLARNGNRKDNKRARK